MTLIDIITLFFQLRHFNPNQITCFIILTKDKKSACLIKNRQILRSFKMKDNRIPDVGIVRAEQRKPICGQRNNYYQTTDLKRLVPSRMSIYDLFR